MRTGVDLELLGTLDELGDPLLGLSDEYGDGQRHAALASGAERCARQLTEREVLARVRQDHAVVLRALHAAQVYCYTLDEYTQKSRAAWLQELVRYTS